LGFLGEVFHYVHDYGYVAVFVGILLENFGLPTPGEMLLISGAIVASHGALDIRWLLPIAWLGAVIGYMIGFFIGKTGGHLLLVRYGGRIGITAERLKQVEAFFDRYGDLVVVFARFVVPLRQFNGIVAGMLEMQWARFLVFNVIGAALWVGFWGLGSYWLGKRILAALGRVEPVLILLVVLAVIGLAIRYLWRRRLRQQQKRT
jgi:membrane protein DedA with SNARE-associated domain